MRTSQTPLFKITALLTAVLFAADVCQCPASTASVISSESKTGPEVTNFFEIPEAVGKIDESYRLDSKESVSKTVIYIQDAHDSLEAQENIAKIISSLVERYGIKTVYEEGYEGPVPTDEYFKGMQEPAIREQVSYFLMDKLRLGGAEYAHINRTKDFKLIGADSIQSHLANIEQYRVAAALREETKRDLEVIRQEIGQLILKFFPREIKEWIKLKESFDGGKLDMAGYLRRTVRLLAKKMLIGQIQEQYPNIDLILATESKPDEYLAGKIKALDPKLLFGEIDRLENNFASFYLNEKRDWKIFQIYKALQLLGRLNAIEVSPSEFEAVKDTLKDIRTEALLAFIVHQTGKALVLSKKWEENIQKAIGFYEIACQRDRAIEKQLAIFAANSEERVAVLVYGGFHKDAIKDIFRHHRLSYQIVMPKIQTIDEAHKAAYKQLMSGGRHSFELPDNIRIASRFESSFGRARINPPLVRWEFDVLQTAARKNPWPAHSLSSLHYLESALGSAAQQRLEMRDHRLDVKKVGLPEVTSKQLMAVVGKKMPDIEKAVAALKRLVRRPGIPAERKAVAYQMLRDIYNSEQNYFELPKKWFESAGGEIAAKQKSDAYWKLVTDTLSLMIKTRIESNQHSIIPRLLKEPIHFIRGLWKTTVDNRYDISHGGVTDLATSHQIRVINFPIRLVDYRGRSVPGFVFKTQMRQPDSKMRESAGSLVIEGFNNDIWAPGGRAGDYKHTAFRHAYASITDIQQAQKHDRQAQYILKALELMGFTNATFLSNLAEQGLVLHIQLETNFPIMSGMGGSVALAALAMYGLAAYKGIDWQEQLTPQDIAAMGILVESSLGGLGGVQDALFMKWMREIVGNGLEDFRNDIAAWLPPDRQRLFLEAFDRHVVLFNFGPHKASNTLQIIIENELRRDPDFLKKREAAAAHFEAVKKSLKGISEKGVGGFGGLLEEKSRTFDQLAPGHLTPEARALKQELLDQGHDVNIAFMGAGAGGFLAIWINYRDDEEDAQRRERDDVIQFLKTKVDPQRDPHGVYPFVSNPDQVGGLTEQFTRKRFGGFPSVMRFFHRILDRGSSSQSDDILLSVRRAFFGLSLAWVFLGWFSGISPFAVIGGLFLLSIFATFFSAWLLSKFVNQSQGLPNEEMMASTIGENDTTSPDKIHVSETAMGVSPRSDEDLSGNGPSFDDESAPAFENALSLTATALASPNRRSPDDHFDLRQVLDHSTANTVILLNGETVKARFSPEQVAELFAWVDWYPGRIKLMFYNADAADSFWMPFHQLPRGTIEMTAGSAEEAYGTAQRVFTQTGRPALHEFIHLSKGDLAAADQVSPEAQQEMLFFRYAPNDSVHGMVAALLRLVHYAEADRLQEGLREMGLGRDAQGFLTFVDQALRQLYLLENARLVVSMSA